MNQYRCRRWCCRTSRTTVGGQTIGYRVLSVRARPTGEC
ncbi:hypothetical protein PpBr36_01965 [Pyricularia pennisetigena]|nr:hypothetical protein PpBr36_01965 [Pyricularia pennisetigena]TLS28380.1 hypothetical protein PpBr36_01965 [Pyricularia pennisetigena]